MGKSQAFLGVICCLLVVYNSFGVNNSFRWEACLSVSKLVSKLETRTSMLDEFQASMTSIDTSIDNLKRKQLNWFNSFEQRASGIDPPTAGFNRNPALLGRGMNYWGIV